MRKAAGGGMAAAAAMMVAATKPLRRLNDASSASFDWQFQYHVDRSHRSHMELLDHPEAPSPVAVVLRLSEHMSPDGAVIKDAMRMMLQSQTTLGQTEIEDLALLNVHIASNTALSNDLDLRETFARLVVRRRVHHLALSALLALPLAAMTPSLWQESMECIALGRMNHMELISHLLHRDLFPVELSKEPSSSASNQHTKEIVARSLDYTGLLRYGLDSTLASKLVMATSRFPSVAHTILERYTSSVALLGSRAVLHPAPFLAFFRCVQDLRDPQSKTPMVHWKLVLRHFQRLNKSCPNWYQAYPAEAADLVRYVILVCSNGANPFLTLNIARVAASRHILDGVELSIWLVRQMALHHHVEETREVAHKLVQWLFHTVGIHLLERFHNHITPLSRSLLQIEAVEDVSFIYNVIIDHIGLFSEDFRQKWMATMQDILCTSCGSVFHDRNIYNDRTCATCMHVAPAKPLTEAASYALSAEHLERLRKRRKAANRESQQRLRKLVTSQQQPTGPAGSAGRTAVEIFNEQVLAKKDHVAVLDRDGVAHDQLEIGDSANLNSLVLHPDASPTDVRSAVEEASRRQDLLERIRAGGAAIGGGVAKPVSVPSVIPQLNAQMQDQFRVARERAISAQTIRVDGVWQCVWCQEKNTPTDSRVTCCACGAETGPEASWRTFLSESSNDILNEIRLRIRSGDAADSIIAAYNLTVYRRSFLMLANDVDFLLVEELIRHLVVLHERVLAGYLFMRLIPASRRVGCIPLMMELSTLFGSEQRLMALLHDPVKASTIQVDQVAFDAVFNSTATCKVCFGQHEWQQCPIVTRDFTKTRVTINLTPEEKKRAAFQNLKKAIHDATSNYIKVGTETMALVHTAYQLFLASPRERFAIEHPVDANQLSRALSKMGEFVRASFVLLHIPLCHRQTETYLAAVGHFGVSEDDSAQLLKKRSPVGIDDGSHPNFVQVTRTCCICLEGQHASFQCPKMSHWVQEVTGLFAIGKSGNEVMLAGDDRLQRISRLRAQADGWMYSGPERLEAFQRFLLEQLEELIVTKIDDANPASYAFNKTVQRLLETGRKTSSLRLYARLPTSFVFATTTASLLANVGYSPESIESLSKTTSGGRELTFGPNERCLCCFSKDHTFPTCPDITSLVSSARIVRVVETVGCIRSSPCGVLAAADYLYREYSFSRMTTEMLRAHPEVVQKLLKLMHRCFATKLIGRGARLLRRIPIEMLEPIHYERMWTATGMPSDLIAERVQTLITMFDEQKLTPSSKAPQSRRSFSQEFIASVGALIHGDHCRHCYEYGHNISTCSLFHEEAEFGRDFIALYRITALMPNLLDHERLSVNAILARFVLEHQMALPYHILGVHNGINALSATFSMDNEAGLGFRVLMVLPPAYRKRHAMHYALHTLGLPKLNCIQLLTSFFITGDAPPPLLQHRGDEHSTGTAANTAGMEPQHLLVLRPPIPDLMTEQVVSAVEGGLAALNHAESRLEPLCAAGMQPRAFIADDAEREAMCLPVDFSTTATTLVGAIWSKNITNPKLPSGGSHPTTSTTNSGTPVYAIKQVCDIAGLREAFSPIMDFMETVSGTKLGSRSPMLYVSEILQEAAQLQHRQQPAAPSAGGATNETATTQAPPATRSPSPSAATSQPLPSPRQLDSRSSNTPIQPNAPIQRAHNASAARHGQRPGQSNDERRSNSKYTNRASSQQQQQSMPHHRTDERSTNFEPQTRQFTDQRQQGYRGKHTQQGWQQGRQESVVGGSQSRQVGDERRPSTWNQTPAPSTQQKSHFFHNRGNQNRGRDGSWKESRGGSSSQGTQDKNQQRRSNSQTGHWRQGES